MKEIVIKGTTSSYFELGISLTISISSNYTSKNVSYKFSFQYRGGETKVISDYSALNKIEWVPELSGTYLIIAEGITDDGQYGKQTKEISVINPNKVEITSVAFDKESPQNIGGSVTIKVDAAKGTSPYKYKFVFSQTEGDENGSSSTEWMDVDTYVWTPNDIGTYTVKTIVEDSGGQLVSDEQTYTILAIGGDSKEFTISSMIKLMVSLLIIVGVIVFVVRYVRKSKHNKKR